MPELSVNEIQTRLDAGETLADIEAAEATNPARYDSQSLDLKGIIARLLAAGVSVQESNAVLVPVLKNIAQDHIIVDQGYEALRRGDSVDLGDLILRQTLVDNTTGESEAQAITALLAAIPLSPAPPTVASMQQQLDDEAQRLADEAAQIAAADAERAYINSWDQLWGLLDQKPTREDRQALVDSFISQAS